MSSAIIKFENDPNRLIYWKNHSYPTGLGFRLISYYNDETNDLYEDHELYEIVSEIPKDIQYEYIVKTDHTVHCQECWFTPDKNYHGGGFRHGGVYDLVELKKKVDLQEKYTTRREEDWNGGSKKTPKWKYFIKLHNKFSHNNYHSYREERYMDVGYRCSDIVEYETDDVNVCKDIIKDFLDIVKGESEIDDEWVVKEYEGVENPNVDSIKRYYNGKLTICRNLIADIDNYLSIDNDTRRNTVFHYDIPYDLNHFEIRDEYKTNDIQEEAFIEVRITI